MLLDVMVQGRSGMAGREDLFNVMRIHYRYTGFFFFFFRGPFVQSLDDQPEAALHACLLRRRQLNIQGGRRTQRCMQHK